MRFGFCKGLLAFVGMTMIVTLAHAEEEVVAGVTGNYYGLQVGTTNLDAQSEMLPNSSGTLVLVRPSKIGVGSRLFWGYQFTKYAALEGGYTYYSPATYNIPNGNHPELRIQGLDLVGKGILPLYWGISFFGKVGATGLSYLEGGLLAPNPLSSHDGANGITVRPLLGLGLSYTFTPNFTVDISATRITAGGVIPKTSFYAVGISYHAVDLYCGQFLC